MPIQADEQYSIVRTTPRKGEVYAVSNRRTGITELRTAAKNFRRDVRRVFVKNPTQ